MIDSSEWARHIALKPYLSEIGFCQVLRYTSQNKHSFGTVTMRMKYPHDLKVFVHCMALLGVFFISLYSMRYVNLNMSGPFSWGLKVVLFAPLIVPIPLVISTAQRFGLPSSYEFRAGIHTNRFPIIYPIASLTAVSSFYGYQ